MPNANVASSLHYLNRNITKYKMRFSAVVTVLAMAMSSAAANNHAQRGLGDDLTSFAGSALTSAGGDITSAAGTFASSVASSLTQSGSSALSSLESSATNAAGSFISAHVPGNATAPPTNSPGAAPTARPIGAGAVIGAGVAALAFL